MSDQLAANKALDRALELRLEELRPRPTVRTYNCLKREGIHTVGDLVAKTEPELLAVLRDNWKGMDEVQLLLAELNQTHGLDLKLAANEALDRALKLPLEELDPSTGTFDCLQREGIHTVGDLVAKTPEELVLSLRGSRRRLNEVQGLLKELNRITGLDLHLEPGDSPFL